MGERMKRAWAFVGEEDSWPWWFEGMCAAGCCALGYVMVVAVWSL
jgi:hypothetical protein